VKSSKALTGEEEVAIRAKVQAGQPMYKVAQEHGIDRDQVARVVQGKAGG